jgi:hypothetical protein
MELRLSPTGKPFIGNQVGDLLVWQGPAQGWVVGQPTPGQSVRYASFIAAQGTTVVSDAAFTSLTDSGGDPVLVTLADPDPTKRYRASARFCYRRLVTTASTFTVRLQASYDGGGTWETWQETGLEDVNTTPISSTLQFSLGNGFTLGSDLGMPVDAPSVTVRVVVQASDADEYEIKSSTPPNFLAIELQELTE